MFDHEPNRHSDCRAEERVFRTHPVEILGYIISGIVLVPSLTLAASPELRAALSDFPAWMAWSIATFAVVLGAAGFFHSRSMLRWVAVSPSGIRWLQRGRIHERRWSDFDRIQRFVTECYYNGQYSGNMHSATVWFHSDEPLVISPHQMRGYEELIAEIQHRVRVLASQDGTQAPGRTAQPADIGW